MLRIFHTICGFKTDPEAVFVGFLSSFNNFFMYLHVLVRAFVRLLFDDIDESKTYDVDNILMGHT